ncbi:hypothetical protein EUTSA_v10012258mg, partial [Eutrema salsugineum]
MNSDSIPFDLIIDIFSRLPTKSIARFCCVSNMGFRSSARPRLLFAVSQHGEWSFFSLPQPYMRIYGYASGLIYFYGTWISEEEYREVPMICNPNTGRYETLPYLYRYRKLFSFFGFDPIDKLFKVLFMAYQGCSDDHKILTLETGEMRWRKIQYPLNHMPFSSEGICINGVLYYLAVHDIYVRSDVVDDERCDITFVFKIVCFDVRSEKFKFLDVESICKLINYKDKLGFDFDPIELRVWVLEDTEKQDWSKYSYTLRDVNFLAHYVSVVGVTATGEIVFSMCYYTSNN